MQCSAFAEVTTRSKPLGSKVDQRGSVICGMKHYLLLAALALVPGVSATAAEHEVTPPCCSEKTVTVPPLTTSTAGGFLGIGLAELDPAVAYHLRLTEHQGVIVTAVTPGSPAALMGLKQFDVIVAADGKAVHAPQELSAQVRAKTVGTAIRLTLRRGADSLELSGAVAARPAELEDPRAPGMGRSLNGPHGVQPRHGTMQLPDGSQAEWSIDAEEPHMGVP